MHFQFDYFCRVTTYDIIRLLDSAELDIRLVVQIEADVGRSEAESNISLDLQTSRTLGEALSNKCFIMPKSLNDIRT